MQVSRFWGWKLKNTDPISQFSIVNLPLPFETLEKCSFLFKFKESDNFNQRNTFSILRIKI
jgi:hypothetical protein